MSCSTRLPLRPLVTKRLFSKTCPFFGPATTANGTEKEDDLRNMIEKIIKKNSQTATNTLRMSSKVSSKKPPAYVPLQKYNSAPSEIPTLKHGLDRALFSPGVHYMQDPRTQHFNFPKEISSIPSIDDFKFDTTAGFIPPARDSRMLDITNQINAGAPLDDGKVKYYSSTSSMTAVLKQFHSLLSAGRPYNTSRFSKKFPDTTGPSVSACRPSFSVVLPKTQTPNAVFSVDTDRSADSETSLSFLGHELELFLTTPPETFAKHLKSKSPDTEPEPVANTYHYARIGKFLMRSQLDSVDPSLPGTGTFDLKTRAVCSVRHDLTHTDFFPSSYQICRTFGDFESYERELFDLVRSAMWKYSCQARIGNMDGVFIAFHNMQKLFGFQYMPLTEMDDFFYGYDEKTRDSVKSYKDLEEDSPELPLFFDNVASDVGSHWQDKREVLSSYMADFEFRASVKIWEDLMDAAVEKTGGQPFRLIVESAGKSQNARIRAMVTVIDEETTQKLSALGDEKDDLERENLVVTQSGEREKVPLTRRIKQLSSVKHKKKREFYQLNESILQKSIKEPKKCFVFDIKATHLFNGVPSESNYPTPSVEILDKSSGYTWDIHYTIEQTWPIPGASEQEESKVRKWYNNVIRDVANMEYQYRGSTRYSSTEDSYQDRDVPVFRRLLRAYSAKGRRRMAMAKDERMTSE